MELVVNVVLNAPIVRLEKDWTIICRLLDQQSPYTSTPF